MGAGWAVGACFGPDAPLVARPVAIFSAGLGLCPTAHAALAPPAMQSIIHSTVSSTSSQCANKRQPPRFYQASSSSTTIGIVATACLLTTCPCTGIPRSRAPGEPLTDWFLKATQTIDGANLGCYTSTAIIPICIFYRYLSRGKFTTRASNPEHKYATGSTSLHRGRFTSSHRTCITHPAILDASCGNIGIKRGRLTE